MLHLFHGNIYQLSDNMDRTCIALVGYAYF